MDLFLGKLGRNLGDLLRTPLRPAIFDRDGATVDPPELMQSLGKSSNQCRFDRSPMRTSATVGRSLACCARAASGNATATLPRSIRNLRRLIAAPEGSSGR